MWRDTLCRPCGMKIGSGPLDCRGVVGFQGPVAGIWISCPREEQHMGDDKSQNAFCTATHEILKQANPLLVNGLPEKQERKWVTSAATLTCSAVAGVCDRQVLLSSACGIVMLLPCSGKQTAFAERRYRSCGTGARPSRAQKTCGQVRRATNPPKGARASTPAEIHPA